MNSVQKKANSKFKIAFRVVFFQINLAFLLCYLLCSDGTITSIFGLNVFEDTQLDLAYIHENLITTT